VWISPGYHGYSLVKHWDIMTRIYTRAGKINERNLKWGIEQNCHVWIPFWVFHHCKIHLFEVGSLFSKNHDEMKKPLISGAAPEGM
jgi:hypothetical protein